MLAGCAADWRSPRRPRWPTRRQAPWPRPTRRSRRTRGPSSPRRSGPTRAPPVSGPAPRPRLFNPLLGVQGSPRLLRRPCRATSRTPTLPGWQLTGGAAVTSGSSPHAVIGEAHANSLSLPAGSSATSPEMCVDLSYPTFRFFVAQLERDTDSDLAVDVIYPGAGQEQRARSQEVQAQGQGRVEAQRRHQARAAAPGQGLGLAPDRHPLPGRIGQQVSGLPGRRRPHRSPPPTTDQASQRLPVYGGSVRTKSMMMMVVPK